MSGHGSSTPAVPPAVPHTSTDDRATSAALARARAAAQRLGIPGHETVAEAAAAMLGTQAQDFTGGLFALGLRTPGSREADVRAALERREVVRTWPARGTLMFVAADDVRWLTALLAPRSLQASQGLWRRVGLEPRDFGAAREAVLTALTGRAPASRPDLLRAISDAGVGTAGERGSHLLRWLAGTGVIVFGAPRGTEQTFALLDEWVPDARRIDDRDEALAEYAHRYLAHRGPATERDLAWWGGLTLTEARRAVDLAADVERTTVGDVEQLTWGDAGAVPPARDDPRLLPPFDELLLGYGDRSASLRAADVARLVPASNGLFLPAVVVDGRVVGTWRRTLTRHTVAVELDAWVPWGVRTRRRLERRVAEYADFVGRDLAPTTRPTPTTRRDDRPR
ncbi:winged helix DNA-binding domain-containing protein [Frigoribacterium sp. Leaf186]|uniref:winged helix DNA-binding domain-containing protein n=1 Tax=Frigoribacterium sp. Leaf186 TaxID=1736293 RepID=UPI0006F9F8FC|nr:winged helix DNA-binding domain-containing protein [Frigoribacterium sp. Leaf186]KQS22847.1 hypothetical protein ASG05_05000 [Frigoribacterium sp. Leaf186]